MKTYTETPGCIIRNDGACIPRDPGNADYAVFLAWVAAGNTPHPAEPAPDAPPRQFTSLELLDLFTAEEQLAVATAAMTIPPVKLWYDRLLAAQYVTIADPRTEDGLLALVAGGLLTGERMAEIVAAMEAA